LFSQGSPKYIVTTEVGQTTILVFDVEENKVTATRRFNLKENESKDEDEFGDDDDEDEADPDRRREILKNLRLRLKVSAG
jgi:hypothetical protein